ncbi:MAG: hypothetical protein ABSD38_35620 [Syntrophorhabdales bacterium]
MATRLRSRPEIALTRLEFAELHLDHYADEKVESFQHLDFAISELRKNEDAPAPEGALRHQENFRA